MCDYKIPHISPRHWWFSNVQWFSNSVAQSLNRIEGQKVWQRIAMISLWECSTSQQINILPLVWYWSSTCYIHQTAYLLTPVSPLSLKAFALLLEIQRNLKHAGNLWTNKHIWCKLSKYFKVSAWSAADIAWLYLLSCKLQIHTVCLWMYGVIVRNISWKMGPGFSLRSWHSIEDIS